MPQGIRIWDAQGNLVLDLTDRLTLYAGSVNIAADTTGSITVTGLMAGNQIWFAFVPSADTTYSKAHVFADIVLNGNQLSWSFRTNSAATRVGGTLHYGIF